MKEERVRFFSDKEEELIDTLIAFGFTRRDATLLVFIAKKGETTTREIEHNTNVQYSSISVGTRYIAERGWLRAREVKAPGIGQATKFYSLALSFSKILAIIESEKKDEMKRHFAVLENMKEFYR